MMKTTSSRLGERLRGISLAAAIIFGTVFALGAAYFFIPPPHQARAQFADQGSWGGTAGGSANALTITLANVATLNNIIGVPIRFVPASNNTGPATVAITNALGTTTATALKRPSSIGLAALSGAELWAGEPTSVVYDGTEFVLSSNIDITPIGKVVQFRGTAAPRGTLIEDGSCVSQTTYAALFSVIGTSYGSCSAGLFALPDSRGSLFAALDNQGANGAANRITNAGSGCTATAVGTRCGAQSQTLALSQLPSFTPSISGTFTLMATSTGTSAQAGSGSASFVPTSGFGSPAFNSIGGGLSHPIMNPVLLGLSAIKY